MPSSGPDSMSCTRRRSVVTVRERTPGSMRLVLTPAGAAVKRPRPTRPASPRSGLLGGPPGSDAVDPLYGDAGHHSGGYLAHRELLPWPDVVLGKPVHHLQRAALRHGGPAADDQVGMKALAGVLVGLERHRDPTVSSQVPNLVLVGIEEGCEDQLVALETGPGQRDVRRAIGAER